MVFGEESFVAFLADKVSAALMRVHVLLQVVGLEEVFVALWALYPALTLVGKNMKRKHQLSETIYSILHSAESKCLIHWSANLQNSCLLPQLYLEYNT